MNDKKKSGFARWISGDIAAEAKARIETEKATAALGGLVVGEHHLSYSNETVPMSATTATIEQDLAVERITATRVVAGALLAGPAGAVIGALAKKREAGSSYLVIDTPASQWLVTIDRKAITAAREVVTKIENSKKVPA